MADESVENVNGRVSNPEAWKSELRSRLLNNFSTQPDESVDVEDLQRSAEKTVEEIIDNFEQLATALGTDLASQVLVKALNQNVPDNRGSKDKTPRIEFRVKELT